MGRVSRVARRSHMRTVLSALAVTHTLSPVTASALMRMSCALTRRSVCAVSVCVSMSCRSLLPLSSC